MKSSPLRALRRLSIMPFMALALGLSACATHIETRPVALDCGARVPPQLADKVEGAALPDEETVGKWVAFGDAQTGKLDQSNDEKSTVLWIVRNCEDEERAAVKTIEHKPLWKRIFG